VKFGAAVLFFLSFLALGSAQDKGLPEQSVASIGLQTGQQAPEFTLPDQFGHEQSNQTLKGLSGTVLLFFRSADW
jgi:cytochrome oxidase Cu insertion factor (SCO1/SenC/PrrC family)